MFYTKKDKKIPPFNNDISVVFKSLRKELSQEIKIVLKLVNQNIYIEAGTMKLPEKVIISGGIYQESIQLKIVDHKGVGDHILPAHSNISKERFYFNEKGIIDASLGIPSDYDYFQGSSHTNGCDITSSINGIANGYICEGYTLTDYITTDGNGKFIFMITNCRVHGHFTYGSLTLYFNGLSKKVYFNTEY